MISSCLKWASSSTERTASVSISSYGRKRLFKEFLAALTTYFRRETIKKSLVSLKKLLWETALTYFRVYKKNLSLHEQVHQFLATLSLQEVPVASSKPPQLCLSKEAHVNDSMNSLTPVYNDKIAFWTQVLCDFPSLVFVLSFFCIWILYPYHTNIFHWCIKSSTGYIPLDFTSNKKFQR